MNPLVEAGDRAEQAIPLAAQLVAAVHEHDQHQAHQILADAPDLPALAVVLAAMTPDDMSPSELLAWLDHPREYQRLRTAGVSHYAAINLARGRSAA